MKMFTAALPAALVLLLAPARLPAQAAADLSPETASFVAVSGPTVALTGVTVIDGTGTGARTNQTIVIEGSRITAVGPAGSVDVPAGADVHDLSGHTVIPGMIGLHNHMFFMGAGGRMSQGLVSSPRLYLAAGVTTIRTTGSVSPYADLNVKSSIERGLAPGPRMHVTAPYVTGPSPALGDMAQVNTPEEARRFVRYWAGEGVSWIKAYTTIRRAELATVIEEAHAQGLRVTGHICSITFQEAVDMGIDNIEHGFGTATDFDPRKRPDECPPNSMVVVGEQGDPAGETARALVLSMVESGVGMTSTMAVIEPMIKGRAVLEERTLEAMAPEVRDDYLETVDAIEADPDWPMVESHLQKTMAFERGFVEAGGVLAAGVDPTGIGGAIAGFGDQRNYQLLTEAGFDAPTVVRIMSANGARIMGVDDDLGTIEAGKLADLVVLDGDLESDSDVIRNVTIVFKDGVGYDSGKLIESVRGMVGIR
ncbi:amidohydrolase family protein [Candidatus Palauibacter sp.]|uniref:amidohydrolase family protein n=1 Tax=Candidatus Palauibacter sp. TaxID=3101350 RepID=UPI003B0145DD